MWYKNVGTNFSRFATIHAFYRQTDGRRDRQTERPGGNTVRCITCSHMVKFKAAKGGRRQFYELTMLVPLVL